MTQKKGERGRGHVYLQHDAWYLQFYQTENRDGVLVRVRKSVKLADKDREHNSATCKAVKVLRDKELTKLSTAPAITAEDMKVVDFWEQHYLPYCDSQDKKTPLSEKWKGTGMRASTVRGFQQVWNQHLKKHFGTFTLQKYTAEMARRFLSSLKTKQGKNTLKHIRALASAMFSEAIERNLRNDNPWHVKLPKDCKESKPTEHYTMEEAENLITSLVEHVDAQLVIALSCFLGLGPAEVAGLQWGDVDKDWIHIRRNKPSHGKVGPPKTKERMAAVPIIDQVRVPLELWRAKCENTTGDAWVIPDLPNMLNRVIKPHVMGERECERCEKTPKAAKGVTWKGLYAGRRGACTAVIEATGGNYAVAQALLRHKTMDTTLRVYKKQITPQGLLAGMQQFQKTLGK
jgi:integrase